MIAETTDYYVYVHRHPISQKDLYVGFGRGDRAYRISTNKTKNRSRGDRHPDHTKVLEGLLTKGYLPHQWVIFDSIMLSRKQAQAREKELINEYRPEFNRKVGPLFSLTFEQAREVQRLRKLGQTYDTIASQMGCSRNTIYRIITQVRGTYYGR